MDLDRDDKQETLKEEDVQKTNDTKEETAEFRISPGSSLSNGNICCFSSTSMVVNFISFSIGLLVAQNKQLRRHLRLFYTFYRLNTKNKTFPEWK